MSEAFPVGYTREYNDEDISSNSIFRVFEKPKTDTSIIKSSFVRGDLAQPITRSLKLSTK